MTEWRLDTGARGLTLCVREHGDPAGHPTVILHGFLEHAATWDTVAAALPGRVLAVDQRGHGLSDHVGAGGFYHFWDYVADLDALVRYLGAPIDLVGHSMGGTVASLYAGSRPDRIRRLVLVEGLGPPDGAAELPARPRAFLDHRADPPRHRVLDGLDDAVRRLSRGSAHLTAEGATTLARRVTRAIRPGDHVRGEARPGALIWTWDPLHRARAPAPYLAESHRRMLREITAPTLLIYGSTSWYLRLGDLAEREACLAVHRRAVLDGVGHHPHLEAPARLGQLIADHLGS